MKIEKSVLIINGIFSGVGLLFIAQSGFDASAFGLLAILLAFLNIILIIVYSVRGNRNGMLNALILAGVLFTIGYSICSNTHFDMR
jgi:hypothetical protein